MTNEQLRTLHISEATYAAAVWSWLRGETITEPEPSDFGLDASVAHAIKRQCQNEHRFKP